MTISAFAVIYVLAVLRKTLQGKLDFYDLFMLSMVAILPAGFALFPKFAYFLIHVTGVVFPSVLMFGAPFLVVFVFMHNVMARPHKIERQNRVLIQSMLSLRWS